MTGLHGSCHCENIEYVFSTEKNISRLSPGKCSCSFCEKHSAEYIFDPEGRLEVTVRDDIQPIRYVFNLKTAEFLSCPTCGTFVLANIRNKDQSFSAINTKTLNPDFQKQLTKTELTNFNKEDREQRKARRLKSWTPTNFKTKTLLEHMKVDTEDGLKTFISKFESKSLPKNKWTHEAHFVVSLWYSYHHEVSEALEKVREFIKAYNLATGVENTEFDGYHETITWLYLDTTKKFIEENSNLSMIKLLEKLLNSEIIDRNYPLKFYDFNTLMSKEARLSLIKP